MRTSSLTTPPSITEPAAVEGDTWTFDVGANLYGALGEAIFLESPKPHALVYFVRQDLEGAEGDLEWGLNVDVNHGHSLAIEGSAGTVRWTPDCVVEAKDGWGGELLERYYCEIKTGDASFERSQLEAMEALATDTRVERYSLRITRSRLRVDCPHRKKAWCVFVLIDVRQLVPGATEVVIRRSCSLNVPRDEIKWSPPEYIGNLGSVEILRE